MPSSLAWLAIIVRISIAPVLLGALAVLTHPSRAPSELGAALGLLVVGAIHAVYWWDPWRRSQRQAVAAVASMLVVNFILLDLLGLAEPLLWLYPALVAGAGLRTPVTFVAIGLTALAAAAPLAVEGRLVHPSDLLPPAEALGTSHSVLLSIVLAGLGMHAVRQMIALNADLHTTRAELADLAVAADRERLARELHDLLARTLSLIAVKAELASRLSANGEASATAELRDVQRLARQAVRDVREAVTGAYTPSLAAELDAAETALPTAGIAVAIERSAAPIDPVQAGVLAWAVREAVTNVVRHSQARTCRIAVRAANGVTTLTVDDDGCGPLPTADADGCGRMLAADDAGGGPAAGRHGAGLDGLADRVQAVGGTLELGRAAGRGFSLRVCLGRRPLAAKHVEGVR